MADEQNNNGGNMRVRNITADRQFSREVQVQRLTVNSSDEKNAASDAMQEVGGAVGQQTATLESTLEKINATLSQQPQKIAQEIKPYLNANTGGGDNTGVDNALHSTLSELTSAIIAMSVRETVVGGGDGDGGGSGVGGNNFGDVRTAARLFAEAETFADSMLRYNVALRGLTQVVKESDSQFTKIVTGGIVQQVISDFTKLSQNIQDTAASMVSFSSITQEGAKKFNSAFDIATTGAANFNRVFTDFAPALFRGTDNLQDTIGIVRESLDSGLVSPIGAVGEDLNEVSATLREARRDMREQGVNATLRLGWQDSNRAILELLDLEKRASVRADLRDSVTQRNIVRQLDIAQLIATNTGRTAAEVIKMNADRTRSINTAVSAGIIRPEQAQNFAMAQTVAGSNMPGFSELITQMAMSGGNLEYFMGQNQELTSSLATMGNLPALENLFNIVNSLGGMDEQSAANALMKAFEGFQNNRFTGVAGAANISTEALQLVGEAGLARRFVENRDDDVQGAVTGAKDILDNATPLSEIKLVTAVIANTAALGINTAALLGGGLLGKGMFSRIGKGVGSLFGKGKNLLMAGGAALGIGGVAKNVMNGTSSSSVRKTIADELQEELGEEAAETGGKAVGKTAGKGVGKSILKKIPLISIIAGAGFGLGRALEGDYTGAGAEVLSGIAGTLPGPGTAASAAIDSGLVAHDLGVFDEMGMPAGSSSRRNGRNNSRVGPVQNSPTVARPISGDPSTQIMETNRILSELLQAHKDGMEISGKIEKNTSQPTEVVIDENSLRGGRRFRRNNIATHSE